MNMRDVPGYPFFPCCICLSEGFSGENNDGCDHTAFERARASGINIHPAQRYVEGRDRHTPTGPSRFAAKAKNAGAK